MERSSRVQCAFRDAIRGGGGDGVIVRGEVVEYGLEMDGCARCIAVSDRIAKGVRDVP